MLKRILVVLFLLPTLVLAVHPRQSVHGVVMTAEELAALNSADAVDTTSVEKSKGDGNGFLRALTGPFRSLGRLFGGKKNDSKRLERITEKDLRKFESVPARVVTDAPRITKKPANDENYAPAVLASASDYSEHYTKGEELLSAGDLNGAISELSRAAFVDPRSAQAKNLLAIAYERKGLRERALESFKAALQLEKNNAEYLNNYGFLLFKNNDLDRAAKYLKRAATISPNDARIWNNLGLVQSRREKFEDAFQSFARAVGPFSAHLNVAGQLQRQGYAKEAIKHLEKAQALRPESTDVLSKLAFLYDLTGRISHAETARRSLAAAKTLADANK